MSQPHHAATCGASGGGEAEGRDDRRHRRVTVMIRPRPRPDASGASAVRVAIATAVGPHGQRHPNQQQIFVDQSAAGVGEMRRQTTSFGGFDRVFGPGTTTAALNEEVAPPLVDRLRRGNDVALIAYGQTGSGKTHTVEGVTEAILTRVWGDTTDVSSGGGGRSGGGDVVVSEARISMMELYTDNLTDLLHCDPTRGGRGVAAPKVELSGAVSNLRHEVARTVDDMRCLIQLGTSRRETAETRMNATSSRSHMIITVTLHFRDRRTAAAAAAATLTIVDLAGSERIDNGMTRDPPDALLWGADTTTNASLQSRSQLHSASPHQHQQQQQCGGGGFGGGGSRSPHQVWAANASPSTGGGGGRYLARFNGPRSLPRAEEAARVAAAVAARREESRMINSSLSALGRVMKALHDGAPHIPYRGSMLTRVLRPCLESATCRIVLMVCVSSLSVHAQQTLCTLDFANVASKIKARQVTRAPHGANTAATPMGGDGGGERVPPDAPQWNRASIEAEVVELRRKLAENQLALAEAARLRTNAEAELATLRQHQQLGSPTARAAGPSALNGSLMFFDDDDNDIDLRYARLRSDIKEMQRRHNSEVAELRRESSHWRGLAQHYQEAAESSDRRIVAARDVIRQLTDARLRFRAAAAEDDGAAAATLRHHRRHDGSNAPSMGLPEGLPESGESNDDDDDDGDDARHHHHVSSAPQLTLTPQGEAASGRTRGDASSVDPPLVPMSWVLVPTLGAAVGAKPHTNFAPMAVAALGVRVFADAVAGCQWAPRALPRRDAFNLHNGYISANLQERHFEDIQVAALLDEAGGMPRALADAIGQIVGMRQRPAPLSLPLWPGGADAVRAPAVGDAVYARGSGTTRFTVSERDSNGWYFTLQPPRGEAELRLIPRWAIAVAAGDGGPRVGHDGEDARSNDDHATLIDEFSPIPREPIAATAATAAAAAAAAAVHADGDTAATRSPNFDMYMEITRAPSQSVARAALGSRYPSDETTNRAILRNVPFATVDSQQSRRRRRRGGQGNHGADRAQPPLAVVVDGGAPAAASPLQEEPLGRSEDRRRSEEPLSVYAARQRSRPFAGASQRSCTVRDSSAAPGSPSSKRAPSRDHQHGEEEARRPCQPRPSDAAVGDASSSVRPTTLDASSVHARCDASSRDRGSSAIYPASQPPSDTGGHPPRPAAPGAAAASGRGGGASANASSRGRGGFTAPTAAQRQRCAGVVPKPKPTFRR